VTGLDLQDMDFDEDNDERPQAGECIRQEYRRLTVDQVTVTSCQHSTRTQARTQEMKWGGVIFVKECDPFPPKMKGN